MDFFQIIAGILALILAWGLGHRHKLIFKINAWMRERIFSDELVLFSGGRVAVLLIILGGVAIFSGLENVVDLQPIKSNIAAIILTQAKTDLKEGRHRRVINRCKVLVRSDPKNIEAWELMTSSWYALGEKELARQAAESLLHADPQNKIGKNTLRKLS